MSAEHKKNQDLPAHVTKTAAGAYKYQRRVPLALQGFFAKKVWDLSLGSDPGAAMRRAIALTDKHDAAIKRLLQPDALVAETTWRTTAVQAFQAAISDPVERWRETPEVMRQARLLSTVGERDQLTVFASVAFGQSSPTTIDDPSMTMTLTLDPQTVPPPTDPTDQLMFNAYRGAVQARLVEIAPTVDPTKALRLLELTDVYTEHKTPNTARSYRQKAKALADAFGNHRLDYYTKAMLRDHRDALNARDVSAASVAQHFNNLQTIFTWASHEHPEYEGLTFPRPQKQGAQLSVEATRWQAFNDDEIKRVWEIVNTAWGPDATSRMTVERRQTFLMAFRIMLYTGMRPSEVFKVKASDIADGVVTIRVTKTTGRKIPLSKHIADWPAFLADGGFADAQGKTIANSMSDYFRDIIRSGGFTNDRHVLYSLKDTLVDRLQRQGVSDDVMRAVIGHTSGQGKLRHYKTPFGASVHGMKAMREALDAIEYWPSAAHAA